MYSTHEAELDLPHLPLAARHVHIVPELNSLSLLSMGQLCDAGCAVAFDATAVTVTYNNCIIMSGICTPHTKLWHVQLTPTASSPCPSIPFLATANGAIGSATPAEQVTFAHATLFSPALSTLPC
jgi:hypothetical protein